MSFPFPGGHTLRTPDASSYRAANPANQSLHTPDASSYRAANQAPMRTPDAALYQAADRALLHPRAPLLVAPPSNDSNHLQRFPRPPITQPTLYSPSDYKSRAVSSTSRVQHHSTSAARGLVPPPTRVSGSGIAPSSGRSRTMSSGPSMRPSVPSTVLAPSFPRTTGHHNDVALANSSHAAQSRYTMEKKTPQHQTTHRHPHHPPINQAPAAIHRHPMLKDLALIGTVAAARADHGEFLWYPVWNIAIKDWMFSNSNTATVACHIAPQYVLSHEYTLDALSPGSIPKTKKTRIIPDFAQVLQHVQISPNGTPILGRQKVILMVENKPELPRYRYLRSPSPFANARAQISNQVVFAFMADPTLHVIGTILTFGSRWRYVEFYRPNNDVLEIWMEAWIEAGDGTYGQTRPPLLQVAVPADCIN